MNLFVLRVPGIVVRKGNGQFPQFFKWNDITNLVNHKRYFGVECQSYDRSAQVRPPTTQFLFCLLFVKKIVDMPGVDDPCLGRILTLHSVIFVSVRPMMVFLSGHGTHQGPSTLPCALLSELQSSKDTGVGCVLLLAQRTPLKTRDASQTMIVVCLHKTTDFFALIFD